ncbi:hypothetical protein [Nocardioides sp.]|uniref:hypothetical protein n=1 Tax=Nocardioides sp. TaxID=35761 RepID=UPI003782E3FD
MATVTMERSQQPQGAEPVLYAQGRAGAYFFSYGTMDLVCATCGFTLFRGMPALGHDRYLVAECPGCGDFMSARL